MKVNKFFVVIVMTIMLFSTISNTVLAVLSQYATEKNMDGEGSEVSSTPGDSLITDAIIQGGIISGQYADPAHPGGYTGDTRNLAGVATIGNRIIGALRVVGSIASVIIILVIGIKYITGSAQEKAEYKKTMIPYLVGAVLIFAASNIAGWVYDWAANIGSGIS